MTVLGKNGDEVNDNPPAGTHQGVTFFLRESLFPSQNNRVEIKVAPGDYEDVRLRLELKVTVSHPFPTPPTSTVNCAGNVWNVSWDFAVLPISP